MAGRAPKAHHAHRSAPKEREFKFQVSLSEKWTDYEGNEDQMLKRAYLIGRPQCQLTLRGDQYIYDFKEMTQMNLASRKVRKIRPPYRWAPPSAPLLPEGACTVIKVERGMAGQVIEINDPNNPGQVIKVQIPANAKAGKKVAVPLPAKGESGADVKKKQAGMSTGAKVAVGGAAVAGAGAAVVGGMVLGDHLAGGDMAGDIADGALDVSDGIGDFAEDAGDWLGDAAEDTGDWVMNLF